MEFKPLPIGVDDFEKLITSGYYFVDKTMLIQELIDKKGDVNLFTRPRRFGKSLNMSMLRYFFEDGRDMRGEKEDYSHLFDGLKLSECDERYLEHMGQYPVISLSLKSAKQAKLSSAHIMLARAIAEEFKRHIFMLEQFELEPQKERFMSLMTEQADINSCRENPNVLPSSYWANTSSNSIVRSLIDRAGRDTKDEIEELIAGGTVEKPVHEDITYDEVYDSMDNLWNFMF